NTIVAVGEGGTLMRTTDGGNNWNMFNSGVTDNLLSVSFVDSFGICGALSQTILYSSNSGASWNIAQSGFFGGGFWGAQMLSPQIGFVAGENSIFQPLLGITTDSGVIWNFIPFYLNNNEGRATGVDFTDLNTGYVSASVWDGTGAIAKTTDSGSNWISTMFTNPLWSIDFPISSASQVGYAVGSEGTILKTYDAGGNWQQQQSGTILKLNKVHFLDLDFGFAVGENGLILKTTTGGEPVTKVDESTLTVNEFKLEQNYPNPFNPSTSLQYAISNRQFVSLKVYDVLGNEIATLVNEEKERGVYSVTFDASNLASGLYLYRIQAGSFTKTKKMILIK
ncbi:MAG: YCF48-related protein, partial [Ignavibacteriaceae bacterium]